MNPTTPDPWHTLRRHTAARIALGRAGVSLPTTEWLRFAQAHALARDAVHLPFGVDALGAALHSHAFEVIVSGSAAADRATYLTRPDLGRRLPEGEAERLAALPAGGADVALVVGDGLSARGVHGHAVPLLLELRPRLEAAGFTLGAVVLARQCRVALGDPIAQARGAQAVIVLLGERPGLSSPDSLGAYLTWQPRPGTPDSARNCISNVRPPEGLGYAEAAHKIAWLLAAARARGGTGVALKDDSDRVALGSSAAMPGLSQR
jgi:ethanolamine ammonia-lyase small subunit